MDFDAFLEGGPPQTLVNGLGQIQARMNYAGPRLAAYGPCWAFWAWASH